MKRLALTFTLVVLLACAAAAAASVPLVLQFSQRLVLLPGHPVVTLEAAPVGMVGFFIRDDRNRATCVMVLRDVNTGAIYPVGQVDAGSCE